MAEQPAATTLGPAEVARAIVDIASDRQGADIVLLDLAPVTTFADYFVIGTCLNARHMRVLGEELDQTMGQRGVQLLHWEGEPESGWILLDFGDVIVHLFTQSERDRYGLERLWQGANTVLRIQ